MSISRRQRRVAILGLVLVWSGGLVPATFAAAAPRPLPPKSYEALLDLAAAVVVAEVTEVDASATAYDGPFWVTARVRKNLDGTLPDGEPVVFAETSSFQGAPSRPGEIRILFLAEDKTPSALGPKRSDWGVMVVLPQRGRPAVKTGFFVDDAEISHVDLQSLRTFLRDLDVAGGRPARVQFALPAK